RRGDAAPRAGRRRSARGGGAPLGQARTDRAGLCHPDGAHVSDLEIRVGPWPRLHARHRRRRNPAGAPRVGHERDKYSARMNTAVEREEIEDFEAHRPVLTGLAYRMLGSRAEAEDVVQDAYLRWHAADRAAIEQPRRYLGTVVTRLCLDRIKSAKAQREIYVGQWLPEPVVDESFDAEAASDLAHDLSVALMLMLERLSPLERAAFLLHDVFGLDFAEVASALNRREAACRQLAARARAHIEAGKPRFPASREDGLRLAVAFRKASQSGDMAALAQLLRGDAVLYTDGGG